jgi:hypothetical protein
MTEMGSHQLPEELIDVDGFPFVAIFNAQIRRLRSLVTALKFVAFGVPWLVSCSVVRLPVATAS